jgi:hypothetical protein
VFSANREHSFNFSINQIKAIVIIKNASFVHEVILLGCEFKFWIKLWGDRAFIK